MSASSKWTNLSGGSTLSQGSVTRVLLDYSPVESNNLDFGFITKSLVCLVIMGTSVGAWSPSAYWESRVNVLRNWTKVLATLSLAWHSQRPAWLSFIIMGSWAEGPSVNSCFPCQKAKHLGKEEWRREISRVVNAWGHFSDRNTPSVSFFKSRHLVLVWSRSLLLLEFEKKIGLCVCEKEI